MGAEAKAQAKARKKHRRLRWALVMTAAALVLPWAAYRILSWVFPSRPGRLVELRSARISTVVLDRTGEPLRVFLGKDDSRLFWVRLEDINPRVIQATVAVEDERFFQHAGVDPVAVGRACLSNLSSGRVVSGASTVTMQIMRMAGRRPRTVWSKMIEAFRALQLEERLSKNEILELYLNLAPYGGNLVGVEAASLRYFGKHACDLTLDESALLAGLPQSPARLRPDRHAHRARVRRDHVLRRMRTCGYVGEEELAVARSRPVRLTRCGSAFEAPHFTRMVRNRRPGEAALRTTLDRAVQAAAEAALRERVGRLRGAGISNGAVVVIENETAAVRALVGSCDFFSEDDAGQVNGALAARSPGSTLKPFTYALAFEDGMITPASVLADVPLSVSGYEPENYDRRFRGPVSVREALTLSLNVPAVRLLRRVGQARVYRLLKSLGISTLSKPPGHYGLSLVLGSAEANLLELTNAYAALARLGIYRAYRLLETEPMERGRRALSKAAAYLTADVLKDTKRLNGRGLWRSAKGQIRMAWKTGTSWGHRDAWTIAYTPEYTVGVWLGNFDGAPGRGLVGRDAAAPVAARIMEQLYATRAPTWYARPDSVCERKVCRLSGMALGRHCGAWATDLCIRGCSSERPCSVHVAARIDEATGTCLCACCSKGRRYAVRVVESWPVDLAAWFEHTGQKRPLKPAHFWGCSRGGCAGRGPRVLSPNGRETYVVEREGRPHPPSAVAVPLLRRTGRKILLKAAGDSRRLYWFVDGALFTSTAPMGSAFWAPRRGNHTVVCSDEGGRSVSVTVKVR